MPTNSSPTRQSSSSRLLAILAVATAVVFAATSCTASDSSPEQAANSADGIDWTSCENGLECASVPVPLDWSDPDGEQITVAVIRHPASKPDDKIGTMFVEPGGPGDTGVGLVSNSGDDLDVMVQGRRRCPVDGCRG